MTIIDQNYLNRCSQLVGECKSIINDMDNAIKSIESNVIKIDNRQREETSKFFNKSFLK